MSRKASGVISMRWSAAFTPSATLQPAKSLTRDDVYFSVPLLKGQISTREFVGGEKVTRPIAAHGAVGVESIDSKLHENAELVEMILDRGLETETPKPVRLASSAA